MLRNLVIVLSLALSLSGAKAQPADVVEPFTTKSGRTYQVEIQQLEPAALAAKNFRIFGFWGAEGRSPSYCVSALKIIRGKATVRLAAKHYLDLCNVNRAWFTEIAPYVVLTLKGGDASDSFRAEFKMHGVNLIERAVRDGQFPTVFEVTRFNYPVIVN